jgi:hypothetical protein
VATGFELGDFCTNAELAPPVLSTCEQVDEAPPLLVAQARNEVGEGIVFRCRVVSATGSATRTLARRNFFVFNGYNGRRSGLQPGGWRFDPGRLHPKLFAANDLFPCSMIARADFLD